MNAISPITAASDTAPLRDFVTRLAELIDISRHQHEVLATGSALLARLIARDDWLPAAFAVPSPERYQQYLLHCDSRERFSVVSFVWGPGQATPVHDHRVWGLVGVLRGAERVQRYVRLEDGAVVPAGDAVLLEAGKVEAVGPDIGDIHRVANGRDDGPSVSIHVYGGNIGVVERATYATDGTPKRFISGYANTVLPNIWDRS
ncbi:cysteine dioxygenase [Sphingomonas sp. NFR15]|uniref:cysteine dioxygenase family protein n=1 Tax=Sphingomonas sp. NFR15 TaxID=1566282 RepID=UPI000887CAEA|nr:cysteine dioxygenase [Sphingomonas sp. NFR15]SDA29629.1 Predicted metal-dependent enzyme of the double-stranded beta helix superfamily [Sphingomonas sp. NFR15]